MPAQLQGTNFTLAGRVGLDNFHGVNFAWSAPDAGPNRVRTPSRVLGVIPARLASSRLPEKPLVQLAGRPLIEWVWRRVRGMREFEEVVVATDSERIVHAVESFGGRAIATRDDHLSGTDRVAEVAARAEFAGFDVVVNVQGDEPLVDAAHVSAATALVREGWPIGTCGSPITSPLELADPNVVKIARAADGRALYFSRAAIPHRRDLQAEQLAGTSDDFLRHIGIYAFSRAALEGWVALPPSALEKIEMLEQLRPLEAGIGIGVAVVGAAGRGVDTPEDVMALEPLLQTLHDELSTHLTENS